MVLLGFVIKYVLKDHFEKPVSGEGLKGLCPGCGLLFFIVMLLIR